MEQPLLTIGAFARAVGLAPSALRYYDECGLLCPAEVDETTGYRYYTPDLARRARAVAQLRDAGVSIDTMRTVLDGPAADGRRVLREVLAEQAATAARRTAALEGMIEDRPPASSDVTCTVDGPELAAAIRQVRAAAHTEAGSPLAGVLLDVADDAVDVVATNRYWMAVRSVPASPANDVRVLLNLQDVARVCDLLDRHDRVTLDINGERLVVAGQRVPVRDAAYPAHRMLLESLPPPSARLLLPRADLVDAITATGHAEFDLEVLAGGVRIGGRKVPGTVDGASVCVRLGTSLVRRAVDCALGPEVALRLVSETQPVRVSSPYQAGFLALLMPIAPAEQ